MTKDVDLSKFLTQERHRVHLIGVAGSGMSGIAGLLLQLGHEVSGSDKLDSLETDRLQRLGLKFYRQHRADHAADAELIVYSSAIKPDNPILKSAREAGKRCV
ncbi:MAG TPA: Mur ligase domain-containing protein, partial [Chthoniobacterales bacterium]